MASVEWEWRRRGLILATSAFLGLAGPVGAQEVLFLRIRPQPDPAALGAAGAAQAALAAREAIWERSNARARTIIESVCTGCLGPWNTPSAVAAPRLVTASATAPENPATKIPAVAIPAPSGVESDPPLEASEPTIDPSFPERRP